MLMTPLPTDPAPARAAPMRFVRLRMTARCATALVGGYGFAAAGATLTARLLPIDRAEATAWSMVLSFLTFAVVALWCFYEQRLGRVALAVWGGAIAMGLAAWLLGVRP